MLFNRWFTIIALSAGLLMPVAAVDRQQAKNELRQMAADAGKLSRAFNLVHEIVGASVVSIHTKDTVRVEDFWGRVGRREIMGEGSGFVILSDAKASYVLTNSHVVLQTNQEQEFVKGANGQPVGFDKVKAVLNDGREADAEYVGYYPKSDLAVLRIPIPDLPPIEWADSDQVHVGDWVVALGYPLAVGYSATAGIVSATDRSTGIYGQGGFDSFVQTDAAINPGNSGGPLVDLQGRVVGVNSNIISRTGANIGLGFAIPSNHARRIADDLIRFGRVHRSVIGVQMQPDQDRVLIAGIVPGSPAATAGLQIGDVVVAVDQFRVTSPGQFQSRMSTYRIGQAVPLTVQRDGKQATVTVAPIAEDDLVKFLDQAAKDPAQQRGVELAHFGVVLAADGRPGLLITAVDPDGVAAAAGLEPGDRLLHEKTLGALTRPEEAVALDKRREITVQVRKDGRNYWLRMRR